jgi:hypothetical protein
MFRRNFISGLAASAFGLAVAPAWGEGEEPPPPSPQPQTDGGKAGDTYTEEEIVDTASDFFGIASEAVAKAVQRVFRDLGQPNAYIKGDEGSAAFLVGSRAATTSWPASACSICARTASPSPRCVPAWACAPASMPSIRNSQKTAIGFRSEGADGQNGMADGLHPPFFYDFAGSGFSSMAPAGAGR